MKKILLTVYILILTSALFAQDSAKVPLNHDVYESWKRMEKPRISPDGKWITYEVNPQKGDGWLYFYNTESGQKDSISRGYDVTISPNSDFIAFKIKAPEKITRDLKMKKKKKEQMPKDSVGVFVNNKITKFGEMTGYYIPKENESWLAYTSELKDTTNKKDSLTYTYLNIINPLSLKKFTYKNTGECAFSKNGSLLGFTANIKNTKKDSSAVYVFDTKKENFSKIYQNIGSIKKVTLDDNGEQMAFIHTSDSTTVKRYSLYYWNKNSGVKKIADTTILSDGWEISTNESMKFSQDGTKLFFQTAPKIMPEPRDSLLEEEKFKVDIWNWNDELLQSQQIHDLDKEKKRTYLAVYNITADRVFQLGDELIQDIKIINKGNGSYAYGVAEKPYRKLISWEDATYRDYYLVNLETGDKKLISEKRKLYADFSPLGNYFLYYEPKDSAYHSYSVKEDKDYVITKSIPVKMYDEEFDLPNDPEMYGIAGWTKDDESVLIYDRYDIWKVNPKNESAPVNLTKTGRETKTIFRYSKLEEDSAHVPDKILLSAQNENSMLEGFYSLEISPGSAPKELLMEDYGFSNPVKAKKSGRIIFTRYSYTEFPDLWTGNIDFANKVKISNANPQQLNYLWGSVELFKWKDSTGVDQKGLIYKPENFDPNKQYPMIAYFYEKYTDRIHAHYMPSPSRSFVNFPLYNSNGYVIFIPDITYKIGYPGKSAYNAIISGTYALLEKGYIDKNNMAIQGQSWGGYQVAYLVTKTNLYKTAWAGAPVSNMTSAYGGIRWESGMVRAFQYEQAQSRIGKTLWDGLDLYLENSPIFHADKIETPLMIMANDNDGAVPWQQGIEFFTALRRLNKPAWMLTYNGDEHNLVKWPNRVDLAKRMMQFFNHYLKGEPMPVWMSDGVKAIEKGIKNGYDLKK